MSLSMGAWTVKKTLHLRTKIILFIYPVHIRLGKNLKTLKVFMPSRYMNKCLPFYDVHISCSHWKVSATNSKNAVIKENIFSYLLMSNALSGTGKNDKTQYDVKIIMQLRDFFLFNNVPWVSIYISFKGASITTSTVSRCTLSHNWR